MKNFFKIFTLAALVLFLNSQPVLAEVISFEASGNYVLSDEKKDSMKNSQKIARTEAINNARAKAEEFIKEQNPNLSQDEIQRVAKKVLKIEEENTLVRLVRGSDKQVEVVSNIKISLDTTKMQKVTQKIIKRRGE